MQWPVTFLHDHIDCWRRDRKESTLSSETITGYYNYCREVCEVIASNNTRQLGGPGKTISVDEMFVVKRKYRKGRISEAMTVTVFGMYCREDKEGLFFRVNGKSKRDLWPYIKKYCHESTSIICSDSARQYMGVENLFLNAQHKRTNRRKGEFVSKDDKTNTINDLENQNKLLKKSLKHPLPLKANTMKSSSQSQNVEYRIVFQMMKTTY